MISYPSVNRKFEIFTVLVAALALMGLTGCSKITRSERALQRAEAYAKAGEYERAEVEYANARRLNPKNFGSFSGLGAIHLEQGRYGSARLLLERARELNDTDPTNLRNLALLTFRTGDMPEAHKQALAVLKKNPADALAPIILAETVFSHVDAARTKELLQQQAATTPSAALQLAIGTLQFRQGKIDDAAASALQAITLDPKNCHAKLLHGVLALARKDRTAAEAFFKEAAELAPRRSTERLALANFKWETGDLAAARGLLENISKETPDYLPAWVKLSELAAVEKRYGDSAAMLEKILSRDPNHPIAILMKGWVNIATGDSAKAVVAAERMAQEFPKIPIVHHQLGLALVANNEPIKAADSLRQAWSLQPGFPEPALLLARLQVDRKDYDSAVLTLQTLLKQRPGHYQTQVQLADTLRQKGDFPLALALLRKLEKEFPTNAQLPWHIGTVLLQQAKLPEARQALTQALTLDPAHKLALEQLVNLDLAEKQYAAATSRVVQFRRAHPVMVEIELLLAKIQLAQGQTAEAERTFQELLKIRPDSQPTLKFLAEIYIRSRRGELAVPHLEKLVSLAPGDLEAFYQLGSLHSQAGRLAEARTAYEKFLASEKNSGIVHNNLASVYTKLGELDRAEQSARKAREFLPAETQGNAADTLGWALFKKKEYAQALALFQEACTKLPGYADHHFHLGLTHYALGQGAAAQAPLEKALSLQPAAPWQAEAEQMLAVVKAVGAGKPAETIAVLSGALEKNPVDVFALQALASTRETSGAYAESAQLLKRALQAQPGNVAVLLGLARLHADQLKSPTEALEYARTAQKLMVNDPAVAAVAGQVAYTAGDHPWAALMLRQAARAPETDPEVRLALAAAEYAIGDVAAARQVLEQVPRDPKSNLQREDAVRLARLISLAEDTTPDKAAAAFVNESLQRDPHRLAAMTAGANLALAEGNPAAAIKLLEAALGLYPNFIPATKVLAGLYVWDYSKQDRTLELATKASVGGPVDPAIEGILGVLNCRRGDFKKAQRQLLAGIAAHPDDARLVFYLGMTDLGLKNADGARASLTRAMAMPGLPVAMMAEAQDALDNRLSMLNHESALAK